MYDTKILPPTPEGIREAAEILRNGGIAAIPTETVYGLAANALDENACREIFKAKGRPSDNPLIVHIGRFEDIYKYAEGVSGNALRLAREFMPGPLTMVLPKKDIIPAVTSGGLDTVGIRFPANKTAQAVINECGYPLAAPSANLSGSPSPTALSHVVRDMSGRIPAIVDGGCCTVGVESTVLTFDERDRAVILRPGFVTPEDIGGIIGEDNVICSAGVTERVAEGERVLSPGMKYKHYAPKANVTIIEGSYDGYVEYVAAHNGSGVFGAVEDNRSYPFSSLFWGASPEEQARRLFDVLRGLDDRNAVQAYFPCPEKKGVGLAVYNRLLRAAGFEVIRL